MSDRRWLKVISEASALAGRALVCRGCLVNDDVEVFTIGLISPAACCVCNEMRNPGDIVAVDNHIFQRLVERPESYRMDSRCCSNCAYCFDASGDGSSLRCIYGLPASQYPTSKRNVHPLGTCDHFKED